MPNRFVAPKRVESLEDVRKALQLVQEQFDANGISKARQQLITKSTTLAAGEFVRVSPRQGQTLYLKLPKADANNIGSRIEISIERPNGTVKIAAEKPDTVSGLATASFTLAGLVILESNGTDQWVLFNQLPTNSPGAATNYFFSNANGVSFGTVGSTVTASVSVASTQGSIRIQAGTTSVLSSLFSFADSNNINWGINTNGVITGSWVGMSISAGTTNSQVTRLRFQNSNNVSWGFNTNGTVTASVASSLDRVAAGTLAALGGIVGLSFQNLNNITWNLSTNAGSAGTAFVQGGAFFGISGGTTDATATGLSFSSPTNTIQLPFNTALTGNVEFFQDGNTISARAAMRMSAGTTAYNGTLFSFQNANRVSFGINSNAFSVPLITASINPNIQRVFAGGSSFSEGSVISFDNSTNNVSFGLSVVGSVNVITASASFNGLTAPPLAITGIAEAGAGVVSSGTLVLYPRTATDNAMSNCPVRPYFSNSTVQFNWDPPRLLGQWNGITGSVLFGYSAFHNRPFFFQPFNEVPVICFGRGDDQNMGVWHIGHSASIGTATASSSLGQSFQVTIRVGLYSVESGTGSRLSLHDSCSFTVSRASGASVSQAMHGSRWIEIPQTNWVTNQGLSAGNWWLGIMVSQANSTDSRFNFLGAGLVATTFGFGNVGLNNAATTANSRIHPFHGFYTTTTSALPSNLASSAVFTATSSPFSPNAWIPAISLNANVNANFG